MSVITKIEEQKNKARVNIFVDDAFFCGLLKESAIKFGLKVGKVVDEKSLQEAISSSEIKSAFDKATDYLAQRTHTKQEIINKLIKKGYKKEIAISAVKKLEEYHYIDDHVFAKQYLLQNKKLSKRMFENKLREKGVDKDIVSEVSNSIYDKDELSVCIFHIEKYIKSKDMSKENAKQKLYASLARKGFSFDIIKKAIKQTMSIDDFNSYD